MGVASVDIFVRVAMTCVGNAETQSQIGTPTTPATAPAVTDDPFVFSTIASLGLVFRNERQMLSGTLVQIRVDRLEFRQLLGFDTRRDIVIRFGIRGFKPHRAKVRRLMPAELVVLHRIAPELRVLFTLEVVLADRVEEIAPEVDAAGVVMADIALIHRSGVNAEGGNGTGERFRAEVDDCVTAEFQRPRPAANKFSVSIEGHFRAIGDSGEMLPRLATRHLELLAGEIATRRIPEADQHFVFFDAWIDDPEFDTEFAVGNALRQGVAEAGFEDHPEAIAAVESGRRGAIQVGIKTRIHGLGSIASKEPEAPLEGPAVTPVESDIILIPGQHKLGMVVDGEPSARFALSDIDHSRIGLLRARVKRFRHRHHPGDGMGCGG